MLNPSCARRLQVGGDAAGAGFGQKAQRGQSACRQRGDEVDEVDPRGGGLALRLRPEILSRTTVSIADTLDQAVLPAAYSCIPITSLIPNQSGWVYTHLLRMIHAAHVAEVEFHYVEAQFHGGVRLQDVECVVAWRLADVPADLQRLCQQAGLRIREFGR